MEYLEFLQQKKKKRIDSGFVPVKPLNPLLFPFQDYIVRKALQAGRFAIFADCGLGKTFMQLEWANHVAEKTGKPVLILCPLAVALQTKREAEKFSENTDHLYITNYDQLHNLCADDFGGVVLDESSILKNEEGAYRNALIDAFANTPYKLACTATPSPNDPMELGNHSEFLNVMSRAEMLAMYFVHDGGETSKWRIKRHAEKDFWGFVNTWSITLCKPSDIGYSDEGYNLPELIYNEKQITMPVMDGKFLNTSSVSATDFNATLRLSKVQRMEEAAAIVNERKDEQFIIWIKQNEEGELLRKLIPDAIEVTGSDTTEFKERTLLEFAEGKHRVLITKLKIASFGLNFQNCHNQVFASLDFSFEALYQGIRRSYRFGQKHNVNIWIITTDTMENVISSIKRKQQQFERMQQMTQECINAANKDYTPIDLHESITDRYDIKRGDSVQLIKNVPDNSIGFSIFSPPFAELYTYSDHIEDMGNSKDYKEFLFAFGFLIKDLFRIMQDGRNVAVHCMDLPIQKGKEGYIGLRDFSGMILSAFSDAGFIYHSRVTIWKNPVTEMQRTKALGLLHKQVKKDATMSRVGIPDYLMVFRKPGENINPVQCNIDVDTWQKYASPVWMDIDYGDTLNFRAGRDEKDEKHICPLQLPTIRRAITLWSNEGDTVFTPFLGIGSEVHEAVLMKRKGIGFELKQSYFNEAAKNCKSAYDQVNQNTLFGDLI